MRLALLSFFDVGESYGLDDRAFREDRLSPGYEIGNVGITNPLGRGITVDAQSEHPELVAKWRSLAVGQVDRPDMELGGTGEEFTSVLKTILEAHDFTAVHITVHAVGVAVLRLEMSPGLPLRFLHGVGACIEFAAYTPDISQRLMDLSRAAAVGALRDPQMNRLPALTRRTPPCEAIDAHGISESTLLTKAGFTTLALLVDPGDERLEEDVSSHLGIPQDAPMVEYEYHGTLRYTWASCLLRARSLETWQGRQAADADDPRVEVLRMVANAEIAHSFLAACEALAVLFREEMSAQVGGYAVGRRAGRDPEELNRLRSLALAVATVTDVDLITPTEEDRSYFAVFNKEANLGQRQAFLQSACEILYNVQQAEVQGEQAQRDRLLGYILAGLTTFTVVSVAADAYNFVRENEPIVGDRAQRLALLIEFLLVLGVLAGVLIFHFMRRPRPR